MKIVIDFRMHQSSGIGTYIRSIVPFLVNEFELILLGNIEQIEQYSWASRVKTISFNAPIYSIKEQLEFVFKIPPCDIFWSPHFNVPLLPIRAKNRLVTIHDVFHLAFRNQVPVIQGLFARLLLYTATTTSRYIFTDSEFSKTEIIRFFKVAKNKLVLTYCAVDNSMFYPEVDTSSYSYITEKYKLPQQFILYVGNVKPHKNLKNLLLALKQLPDVNLVIVGKRSGFITGDDKIMNILEQDQSLKSRVFFTRFVENADITTLYHLAEVFVFPTLYEGFGLPPLEAQACGCPVIVSKVASLPEVCANSAVYCDPYDITDIAAKISMLLLNKTLQQSLREKGLENIKRFSWEASAQSIIAIIKQCK